MAMADYPDNNKPVGDSIREIINPALNDERKQAIQLDILDHIFSNTAQRFPDFVGENLMGLFNKVSHLKDDPAALNARVINLLTQTDGQGRPQYSPIITLGLPIVTDFTTNDIRELPGYIKLHEAARAANVAISVTGLLKEEKGGPPPRVTINCGKTYEQGAMENSAMYPNLPEPPPRVIDPKKPKDIHF